GKLVLARQEDAVIARAAIDREGSYLISGGLGGLGRLVASWLAKRGAKAIGLLGRSSPSAEARREIAAIEALGARVLVLDGKDVSNAGDVAAALAALRAIAPLRGVFHAAVAMADATVARIDRARLDAVMGAKAQGAWVLHEETRGDAL